MTPVRSPSCNPKVAIIGAGFAGLMAARTLCRQGLKQVQVFEARAQVGGRVLSDAKFSNGRITEIGAELVGSIHTRWCELAIEYGLGLISRMSDDLYRGQGLDVKLTLDKPLSMAEILALGKEMEDRVLRPIAKLADGLNFDPSRPWAAASPVQPGLWAALQQYDLTSVASYVINRCGVKRTERLWLALQMLLANNNVKPLEQLNFLGLLCLVKGGQRGVHYVNPDDTLMGYWNELELYRCAEGCQQLALEIAKDIARQGCQVHLRRAVTHIDLSKGVSLKWKPVQAGGQLNNGQPRTETFDYVILAIPPSVWGDVDIQPVHPKDPGQVGLMAMGPAVKFFSHVKERFWIRDRAAPSGGSLALGQVWEGTENQTHSGTQGTVLNVFAGARAPTPDDFKRELATLYPRYPQQVTKTLFANWPRQPFIKTGYASPALGQVLTVGKRLNEPFKTRMFFAGEHTQMDHFGYMEGALRSGERAAHLLMASACGVTAPADPSDIRMAGGAGKTGHQASELPWQEVATEEAAEPQA